MITNPRKKKKQRREQEEEEGEESPRHRQITLHCNHATTKPYLVIHWLRVCHRHKYPASIRVDGCHVNLLYEAPEDISLKSAPKMEFLKIPDYGGDDQSITEITRSFKQAGAVDVRIVDPDSDLLTFVTVVMNILSAVKAHKVLPESEPWCAVEFVMRW